jgi:hypothetical protein
MPAKKDQISDEERARRLDETARKIGTSDDPQSFENAFERVVKGKSDSPKRNANS